MRALNIFILLLISLFFLSCSKKGEIEYNKPAIFWYQKIVSEVSKGDLDSADEYYSSLSSEHMNSIFLKEAMLILAMAHINKEEYLLAKFYLDEYIKKFGDRESIEYAKFMKLKASFLAFKYPYREQKLLFTLLKEIELFKLEYPNSSYTPFIETMEAKVNLSIDDLNKEIAMLYDRVGKDRAKEFYQEKIEDSKYRDLSYDRAKVSWYRAIFE